MRFHVLDFVHDVILHLSRPRRYCRPGLQHLVSVDRMPVVLGILVALQEFAVHALHPRWAEEAVFGADG